MAKPFYYGGQAVMEGVMMRGRKTLAVACRAPNGDIVVYEEELKPGPVLRRVRNWPFIRGAVVLWDTLTIGMRSLIFSANVSLQEESNASDDEEEEEPVELSGVFLWATVAISILFAIGLFFVAPLAIMGFLDRYIEYAVVSNIVEGVIRLAVLIGYLSLIARMDDIRRVFAYHGAEHKTINAFEAGLPLNVEHVRTRVLEHVRCGTGFLLLVVLLSILVFALLGRPPWIWRVTSRIVLVPFIAAIGYEIIRFGAAHAENVVMKAILKPGLVLQRLTTREPEDDMLEVSIAAFTRVAVTDGVLESSEVQDGYVPVDQMGYPIAQPEPVSAAAD